MYDPSHIPEKFGGPVYFFPAVAQSYGAVRHSSATGASPVDRFVPAFNPDLLTFAYGAPVTAPERPEFSSTSRRALSAGVSSTCRPFENT